LDFKYNLAMSNFTEELLTPTTIRLIVIVGGYLLLRPYLQQFLGVSSASDDGQCSAGGSSDAQMPKATTTGRAAGRSDDDSGTDTRWRKPAGQSHLE